MTAGEMIAQPTGRHCLAFPSNRLVLYFTLRRGATSVELVLVIVDRSMLLIP